MGYSSSQCIKIWSDSFSVLEDKFGYCEIISKKFFPTVSFPEALPYAYGSLPRCLPAVRWRSLPPRLPSADAPLYLLRLRIFYTPADRELMLCKKIV